MGFSVQEEEELIKCAETNVRCSSRRVSNIAAAQELQNYSKGLVLGARRVRLRALHELCIPQASFSCMVHGAWVALYLANIVLLITTWYACAVAAVEWKERYTAAAAATCIKLSLNYDGV